MKQSSFIMAAVLLLAQSGSCTRRAMLASSELRKDFLRGQVGTNPVSRVVELLNQLTKEIEKDGDEEEALYKKFVCWAETIINSKTASNEAAASKITELKAYIDDIENGKIDFTTEQADLEKEIKTREADHKEARDLRAQEADDYASAKDELEAGIAALQKAVAVLDEATKEAPKKNSMFLTMESTSTERSQSSLALNRALAIADTTLDKADSEFLHRLLTGDVPRADWKTLNRKATFKSKYKARSTRIQSILADMLATFQENLNDANTNEDNAITEFNKLDKNRQDQLDKLKKALQDLEKEAAARGQAKEESLEEISNLETQKSNDEKFIEQTRKALSDKKEEWRERSRLRTEELASIAKAIEILHNDDSRDNFKKSFDSQGYLFLQRISKRQLGVAHSALAEIKRVAAKDVRLKSIVKLADHAEFAEVLTAIDGMVTMLKDEEQNDLDTKDKCEADRMDSTRKAVVAARTMDEKTDSIEALEAKIETNLKEIDNSNATVQRVIKDKEEATEQRGKEHEEFQANQAVDQEAVETVGRAIDVLKEFYTANNLNLIQKQPAGEAPPPPPTTWDAPYGGKKDEHSGIVAILAMIQEDINKDLATADAAEQKAVADFNSLIEDLDKEQAAAEKMITDLQEENTSMESTIKDDKQARSNQRDIMDGEKALLDGMREGCDFFLINYETRRNNRHIEIDGLLKAKAILEGGRFSAPEDPNRELKPGDA